MSLTWDQFTQWLDGYFAAWKTNDPVDVAALFAENAVYYYGPFREPSIGRQMIVDKWVADPMQQRDLKIDYTPLALNGNLGVAHWRVAFHSGDSPTLTELDGILVLSFDDQGRCTEHREWYEHRETG